MNNIRIFKKDNIEIRYLKLGDGNRNMLVIPGVSITSVLNAPQALKATFKDFINEYSVYVLEPNLNMSKGYNVFNMADDIACLIEGLKLSPVYLYGVSLGGIILQILGIKYPKLCKKIAIVSTSPYENEGLKKAVSKWIDIASRNDLRALAVSFGNYLYSEETLKKLGDHLPDLFYGADKNDIDRFILQCEIFDDFNIVDDLHLIKTETLVIGSNDDKVFGIEPSELIANKIKCKFIKYSGYGHAVYDECKDVLVKVKKFFDDISLDITLPNGEIGFIEDKRSFVVQGKINSKTSLNDNCLLSIKLLNEKNNILRHVECDYKNKHIYKYVDGLTTYKVQLDPSREKMEAYGFPELIVDDICSPFDSMNNATIKAWYSDTEFKAIIVNASNKDSGALFDDGMNYVDENGKPYNVLKVGKYKIAVSLSLDGKLLASTFKYVEIGKHNNQAIARFNPVNHKQAMISWCDENNFNVIKDLLPGYLEPYLGTWYYHMGLLKMYRANDLCLYQDVDVHMFNYLIDSSSTSYETELAYLQTQNVIGSDRFNCYHYDIGEASFVDKKGSIVKFEENEFMYICRLDLLNLKQENEYYLDDRYVIKHYYDINDCNLNTGSVFAITGVIKPWQMNNSDFILKNDNTYQINDYPDEIKYTFNVKGKKYIYGKHANMKRFDRDKYIGDSVFEFYNCFKVLDEWKNSTIEVNIDCYDKHNTVKASSNIRMNIK